MRSLLFLALSLSLYACGGGSSTNPGQNTNPVQAQIDRGQRVYEQILSYGNDFTCATCHALEEPASDGLRRPGHAIGDALRRASFKNGRLDSFLDSANSCLSEWMNVDADAIWTESAQDYQDLKAFLEDNDDGQGEANVISFDIVTPLAGQFTGGDPVAGKQAYDETCVICHGSDNAGTAQGPAIFATDADAIASKVRLSGKTNSSVYDGLTGGSMPFWANDRLSDLELANIVAYIQDVNANRGGGGDNGGGNNNGGGGTTGGCSADHPKVGQVAELVPPTASAAQVYGVSGQARIIDDCTIRLENFNYDGNGIRVRVFGGNNGNYSSNIVDMILPNGIDSLVRPNPYVNETLDVTIPDGFSLDDFDGVSIWCTGIRESFGDGQFETPMQSFIF